VPERESVMTHGAMTARDADEMDLGRTARLAWGEPAPDEESDRLTVGADPDGASRVGEKGRRTHVFDL
jgi:hypothetical protein